MKGYSAGHRTVETGRVTGVGVGGMQTRSVAAVVVDTVATVAVAVVGRKIVGQEVDRERMHIVADEAAEGTNVVVAEVDEAAVMKEVHWGFVQKTVMIAQKP